MLLILLSGYHVGDTKLTWNDAEEYCQQYGSHLATIKSSEDHGISKALCYVKGDSCWIGNYHNDTANTWQWADGSELDFGFNSDGTATNSIYPWNNGQPNLASQDCTVMHWFDDYRWHDADCDSEFHLPVCNYGVCYKHI